MEINSVVTTIRAHAEQVMASISIKRFFLESGIHKIPRIAVIQISKKTEDAT